MTHTASHHRPHARRGQQHPIGSISRSGAAVRAQRDVLHGRLFQVQGYLRWVLILAFMLLKAGLIVAVFMHMAWERLALVYAILVPPLCLLVLVRLMAAEAGHTLLDAAAVLQLAPHHVARDHRRLLALVEGQAPLAQRDVGRGGAVEAPQVLGPGLVDDLLDEAGRLGDVVQQLPADRALAQAGAPASPASRARKASARAGSIRYSIVVTHAAVLAAARIGGRRGPAGAAPGSGRLLVAAVGHEAQRAAASAAMPLRGRRQQRWSASMPTRRHLAPERGAERRSRP